MAKTRRPTRSRTKPTADATDSRVAVLVPESDVKEFPEGVARPLDHLFVYTDTFQIPVEQRMLGGGQLDVHQVNWILRRAYETALWNVDDRGRAIHFIPQLGQARREFQEDHEVQNGVWIPKREQEGAKR